ncbi:unnamed protein product [Effrenium voratum]|uniref:Sulfotransferase n=1 Tax=Effrenium voratum TaxID=2562239 RepID=A0AA36MPD4_9DINO|nr:unnamed protein product [Effrenium voratum]CAJ1379262.1 unnamed protein product [Effrenium voratum]CAJ1440969.1 unnamed protein product [Effrenium voratum]
MSVRFTAALATLICVVPVFSEGTPSSRLCDAVAASAAAEERQGHQLLQVTSRELRMQEREAVNETAAEDSVGGANLQFIHIPCTFGHTVEEAGAGGLLAALLNLEGHDAARWGELHPGLQGISKITGCNLFYTPPKYWPSETAELLRNQTLFSMLRDPYDRLANEFRMQVGNTDSAYLLLTRSDISAREGNLEREGEEYQRFYRECDVNGYLQVELRKYLAGDRFRGNCHLLPSSEFASTPYGPVEWIDERFIPDSFDRYMESHKAKPRMTMPLHNVWCNDISAYSLNEETKQLIRQVYAADFELICKTFGHCDKEEMFCHENIPNMCGSKP